MYVKAVCLLLLSTLSTVSAVRVTGVLGGRVTLPCIMTKHLLDNRQQSTYPASSVRWQLRRDGNQKSVVWVNQNGVTYKAHSMISRAMVQTSQIEQGVFSLHLKDVREQDAGTYHGKAKYGNREQTCIATLRIIKLTQTPRGPLPENSSVNLTCAVVNPEQSFLSPHFFHRGVLVHSSNRISVSGANLYLHSLSQNDQGQWSCEMEGVRSNLMLRVLGISGPYSLSVYTATGSPVELPCNVTEQPMIWPLSVRWSKGRATIGDNRQVLLLDHVRPEDTGTYRCDVTYRTQLMTRQVNLRVIQVFPPGPTFARAGSSLQLVCNVSGSSGEEHFEWTGPSDTTGQRKVLRRAVLDLHSVHTEDSGTWICSVYGMNGILGKMEHWLYVNAPQTAGVGSLSSWHVILLLSLLLVFGIASITVVSLRNRRRRLSHLAALTSMEDASISQPKKISVCE